MQKERLALLALLAVHLHHVRVQVAFLHALLRLAVQAHAHHRVHQAVFRPQVLALAPLFRVLVAQAAAHRAFRPLVRRVLHFPAHLLLRLLVFHLLGDGLMDLS